MYVVALKPIKISNINFQYFIATIELNIIYNINVG